LANGEIKGIDLQKEVNNLLTLQEKVTNEQPSLKPKPTDSTKYHRFKATVKLANGTASNDDLDLQGPFLVAGRKEGGIWATGKGTANLITETLRYELNVKVAEDVKRKGTTFPIDVRGSFAQPTYSVGWNEIVKDQVKKKLEQKKEEKKEDLEDKLKEKLRKKYKLF
ncbi:MAG: hypothetical protein R3268_13495, partial [Acidiferrobacterales bacterium]|nr:hypothetical protein [Acidiferrobacterales bacterium]